MYKKQHYWDSFRFYRITRRRLPESLNSLARRLFTATETRALDTTLSARVTVLLGQGRLPCNISRIRESCGCETTRILRRRGFLGSENRYFMWGVKPCPPLRRTAERGVHGQRLKGQVWTLLSVSLQNVETVGVGRGFVPLSPW